MKALLIDGLNFIWRGAIKFGGPPVTREDWTITFNTLRNIRALKEKFNPCQLYLILEGNPKFRFDALPNYKGTRKYNSDFHRQKNKVLELFKLLPIKIIKSEDYECDDVINTLCNSDYLGEIEKIVVSNDSDFLQIIQKNDKIKIYSPAVKNFLSTNDLPYDYVCWKSLAGDKSDNIPNLVGKKTAIKLASNKDELDSFLKKDDNQKLFDRNVALIKLQDVPLDKVIEISKGQENFTELKSQCETLGFNTIIEDKYWNRFVETFRTIDWKI